MKRPRRSCETARSRRARGWPRKGMKRFNLPFGTLIASQDTGRSADATGLVAPIGEEEVQAIWDRMVAQGDSHLTDEQRKTRANLLAQADTQF